MPVNILVLEAVLEDMALNAWFCRPGSSTECPAATGRAVLLRISPFSVLSAGDVRGASAVWLHQQVWEGTVLPDTSLWGMQQI